MGRVASAPEGFLRGRGVGGERMRMEEPGGGRGGPEVRRADFAFLPPLLGAFPLLGMECGRGRGGRSGAAGQR